MLNIKPIRQTTSHCGPSCLKMVFDYYDLDVSLKKISKIAKTSLRHGTSNKNMVLAAKHFGFNVEYLENLSIKELSDLVNIEKLPVIVNWFSYVEKHYLVVVGVGNKNIYFIDSEDGHRKKVSIKVFKKLWFDFSGDYIRSHKNLRLRPVIVIKPKIKTIRI